MANSAAIYSIKSLCFRYITLKSISVHVVVISVSDERPHLNRTENEKLLPPDEEGLAIAPCGSRLLQFVQKAYNKFLRRIEKMLARALISCCTADRSEK